MTERVENGPFARLCVSLIAVSCLSLFLSGCSGAEQDGRKGEKSGEATSSTEQNKSFDARNSRQTGNGKNRKKKAREGHEFATPEDAPLGRWRKARTVEEQIDLLEGIGYSSGSAPASIERGVTIHESEAGTGYNLVVSGHGPEAMLIDMKGNELHRWSGPFNEVLPGFKRKIGSRKRFRDFWRRAHVFPNGDLLAIFEGHALIKLDRDSNVLWTYTGLAHHDLEVQEDGRIYLLTRKGELIPRINPELPVLEDFVVILNENGKPRLKVSILECFENSKFAYILDQIEARGDFFHTNTIEVLDGSLADQNSAFAKGNVLISILWLSTIAILDPHKQEIVWALAEGWREQHQPTMLPSGAMMLFDNLGGDEAFGRTRVIEFDPLDFKVTWTYEGDEANHFQSDRCGSCQRLPNGNTLITETDNGRAFEVTPEKKLVWEFLNPNRSGDDETLIASLFEVVRLPPEFPVDWANSLANKTK